jgi:hypothetical protein
MDYCCDNPSGYKIYILGFVSLNLMFSSSSEMSMIYRLGFLMGVVLSLPEELILLLVFVVKRVLSYF